MLQPYLRMTTTVTFATTEASSEILPSHANPHRYMPATHSWHFVGHKPTGISNIGWSLFGGNVCGDIHHHPSACAGPGKKPCASLSAAGTSGCTLLSKAFCGSSKSHSKVCKVCKVFVDLQQAEHSPKMSHDVPRHRGCLFRGDARCYARSSSVIAWPRFKWQLPAARNWAQDGRTDLRHPGGHESPGVFWMVQTGYASNIIKYHSQIQATQFQFDWLPNTTIFHHLNWMEPTSKMSASVTFVLSIIIIYYISIPFYSYPIISNNCFNPFQQSTPFRACRESQSHLPFFL